MGYPKQVHEKAWDKLISRRESAKAEAARRRREIHEKIPQIEVLERKMAASAAGITKAIVLSPDEADALIKKLADENLNLQNKRAELLEHAGYPGDYLAERHYCEKCRDTGYIGSEMCTCLDTMLKAEALEYLSSGARGENCTFDHFSLSFYPNTPVENGIIPQKRMKEVFEFCKNYTKAFRRDSESLLFIGQTGLGKTHMSLAIAQEITERGFGVLYASTQQLMDRLESERFSRKPDSQEHYSSSMEIVMNSDLLILDDLGAEFSTSFTNSALYNIVNTRMLEKKPVIISTNLELAEIEARYTQRMTSRLLCEYRVVRFLGKDIRMLRKMNNKNSG